MAMKIKDGLFIGDGDTSQSEDFINDNKISNLINLAGKELPNLWASHGLVYMTFNWEDRADFKLGLNLYKTNNDFISDMIEFIDVSIMHGISVLIFSRNGCGRCAVAACIYLMVKYRWGFEKAFEFVYSKKPDISINRGFVQQLYAFDKFLLQSHAKPEHAHYFTSKQGDDDLSTHINTIATTVLNHHEYQRWREWDPEYMLNKSKSDHASSRVNASIAIVAEPSYDDDELLLVSGFRNSKVTITALPGPYRSLLTAPPKPSKLQFSSINHYDDDQGDRSKQTSNRNAFSIRGILKHYKSLSKNANDQVPSSIMSTEVKPYAVRGGSNNHINTDAKGWLSFLLFVSLTGVIVYLEKSLHNSMSTAAFDKSNDRDSRNSNLYNYVGLESLRTDTVKNPSYRNNGQHENSSKSSVHSAGTVSSSLQTQLTAEERLRKLVAGLTHPVQQSSTSSSTVRHSQQQSHDPIQAFDKLYRGVVKPSSSSSDTLSLSQKNAWVNNDQATSSNRQNNYKQNDIDQRDSRAQLQSIYPPSSSMYTNSTPQKAYRFIMSVYYCLAEN